MKRTALAVLVAMSIPAAAAADSRLERRPEPFAPAPVAAPVREEPALRRVVTRYLEALQQPGDRRRVLRLEAEVGAAIERELAEARAALASVRPEPWDRGPRAGSRAAARAQVARLLALRDEFGQLQGRFGRRAVVRKEALAHELVLVAGLEPRRPFALAAHDGR